jgi:hypothetical protein
MFAPLISKPRVKAAVRSSDYAAPRPTRSRDHDGQREVEQTIAGAPRRRLPAWEFSTLPLYPPGHAQFEVGAVNDPLEHEADRVADQVIRMSGPAVRQPTIRRIRTANADDRRTGSDTADRSGMGAAAALSNALGSTGRPLEDRTRSYFETRFGADFSRVRVHDGGSAIQSARRIDALAYTVGQHVVFGEGGFAPDTAAGRRLLAHELAHVVQQDGARPRIMRAPQNPPPATPLTLPIEGVDMPWIGSSPNLDSSDLGYRRDSNYFWNEYEARWPEQLSPANRALIASDRAPIVDATWLLYHPQHAAYAGDTLEHHHVGQGPRCVPIPEGLHDAYTIFHPQRRTVGTPSRSAPQGGEGALPPRPTRAGLRREVERHVREGRLPAAPERLPEVPPGSPLSGVPAGQRGKIKAPPLVPAPKSPMDVHRGGMSAPKSPMDVHRGGMSAPKSPMDVHRGGMPAPKSPMDVHRGGMPAPKSPMDVHRGGMPAPKSPMDVHRGGMPAPKSPMDVHRGGMPAPKSPMEPPTLEPPTSGGLAARGMPMVEAAAMVEFAVFNLVLPLLFDWMEEGLEADRREAIKNALQAGMPEIQGELIRHGVAREPWGEFAAILQQTKGGRVIYANVSCKIELDAPPELRFYLVNIKLSMTNISRYDGDDYVFSLPVYTPDALATELLGEVPDAV